MNDVLVGAKEVLNAYKDVDLVIGWSREETFNRCKREALFSYEDGLEVTEEAVVLDFGSRFHKHVELESPAPWDGFREEGDHARDYRTKIRGIELGDVYVDHYMSFDRGKYDVVGVELEIGIVRELDGKKVLIKGTMDQVLKSKETGLYWVKDLKTTAMYIKEDIYFKPWVMGKQGGYYVELLGEFLKHLGLGDAGSIGGVIVDVAMIKSKVDESCIKRKIIEIEEMDWDGWQGVAREWLREKNGGDWRRNVGACIRYNSLCPFYLPCLHGRSEYWLKQAKLRVKSDDNWHK